MWIDAINATEEEIQEAFDETMENGHFTTDRTTEYFANKLYEMAVSQFEQQEEPFDSLPSEVEEADEIDDLVVFSKKTKK